MLILEYYFHFLKINTNQDIFTESRPIFKIYYDLTDPNIYIWAYILLELEPYTSCAYWPARINGNHRGPEFKKRYFRSLGQEVFQN